MKKKIILSAILSILPFTAMAETPSFDYFDIGYSSWDLDGFSKNLDGYELKLSQELSNNFYAAGSYQDIGTGPLDASLMTLGLGYKTNLSNSSVLFTELDWARIKTDVDYGDQTFGIEDHGYQASVGIRHKLSSKLEIKGAVEYLDFGNDDSTTFVFGAVYDISKSFALYSDIREESDATRYSVGVRFNF
ncbi:MAG: hypothetical protein COW84_02850 [Gammaproteobacteria bacterium CG22_combo_CG10-13_8_21_14_all_40_8]|nr:MAG: hypothetical protein COW84_02850 [Gammaproteobacteria bacterium CG22_combo_CG10-13_8_21_14_all_40_8]